MQRRAIRLFVVSLWKVGGGKGGKRWGLVQVGHSTSARAGPSGVCQAVDEAADEQSKQAEDLKTCECSQCRHKTALPSITKCRVAAVRRIDCWSLLGADLSPQLHNRSGNDKSAGLESAVNRCQFESVELRGGSQCW